MMQVTHDNHFVPQFYLKRWSKDGHRIWCYRILVPQAKVPEWKLKSIRGIAYQRDLYTSMVGGQEIDEFERWIESEFENPAQDTIERVLHGDTLSSSDWERLVLFLASQDVRTPQSYFESIMRWYKKLPKIFQQIIEQSVQEFEEAAKTGRKLKIRQTTEKQYFTDAFHVKVNPHARPETNQGEIKVKVASGRRLWLESQHHLLEKTAKVLLSHHWSIAEAANDTEWFTSDHPVVRVNYYGEGKYDLKGGWGKEGCNLLMPISPKHLLFTEIGKNLPNRFVFTDRLTYEIKRFIAERAYRSIFAHKRMPEVKQLRPRIINLQMYREEQEVWRNWHNDQCKIEQDFDEGK